VRLQSAVDRPISATVLSWLAMVGLDLALHAGLLAPLYDWDSPFLLNPEEAFARIPAGYLALLVLAAALVWLLPRLGARTAARAAITAGATGAVVWAALLVGLWSITTADPVLLVAWWAGQTLQLAAGGYVIGAMAAGARTRTVGLAVVAVLVAGLAMAVVLQSTGYAPAPVRRG
jgi:hypothetical protein